MSNKSNDTKPDQQKQQKILGDLTAMAGVSEPTTSPPSNTIAFTHVPPKDYDLDVLEDFLDHVFHSDLAPDEHVLTWMVKPNGSPSYPKSEDSLIALLEVTREAKALYFGTAACTPDPDDGKLYNRKARFSSLRVVVLDDIGTKIPFDKMPEGLVPSYEMETSEGNFQYGLILDEPLANLPAAEALIQLVYESGYTDEGGKMPNKIVRLPEGVNGKKGKAAFPTTLKTLTDKVFSPQEILDALNINVRWPDVLADADGITKRRAAKSTGSTPWATVAPKASALNGMIDPVLEWLYDTGQVVMDNGGPFVEIICPWASNHSTGGNTAGYAPLGRGDDVCKRGFNCFHDGCSTNKTAEFVKHVAATCGLEAGIYDPAAKLTTQYVFDKMNNSVWDIKTDRRDMTMKMDSFSTLHPHSTVIYDMEGKPRKVGEVGLWKTSASRVVVAGAQFDPSTTARLIERKGEKYVNLFSIPDWGHGPTDMTHVKKFNNYLAYLIPSRDDRDYFIMWLAAKCQDMSFRGAAIVMIAVNQGVGRSTLGDMIGTLMGNTNVTNIPLSTMLGSSDFNEWQQKPFVITEETLAADKKDFYANYERLKGLIDPRATQVTINPKFGTKFETTNYASNLFLTNHTNAIAIPETDRRFMVIENVYTPAKPAVFTALNKWLDIEDVDGLPLWARHVYRWLLSYETDIEFLTSPPPKTAAKKNMAGESLSDVDFAVAALIEFWPDAYMTASDAIQVLNAPVLAGPLHLDDEYNIKFIRKAVNNKTAAYKDIVFPVYGKSLRPRVLQSKLNDKNTIPLQGNPAEQRDRLIAAYKRRGDMGKIVAKVKRALEEDGRI